MLMYALSGAFTFQYEKINTEVAPLTDETSIHLHSNMKRLIQKQNPIRCPLRLFTFQYEKINTLFAQSISRGLRIFTFQYEKINTLIQLTYVLRRILIYIPI